MIPKTFFIPLLGLLILLAVSSAVLAQPEPVIPSNKPQVGITATPAGTVSIKPVSSFYSPTIKVNYVREKSGLTPQADEATFDASGYEKVSQSTQYLDGLGRPLQTVVRQITPGASPKDIVTPVEYDVFGREVYKYLPYAASTTGDGYIKMDPFSGQDNFYKSTYRDANGKLMYEGEQFLYAQTNYEASPLNRVNKTMAPGNSWAGKGKGVRQQYLINTEGEGIRIWNVASDVLTLTNQGTTNIPMSSASYGTGQLYKNVTLNEHDNAVVEYKDKEGRVVLKKLQIADNVQTDFSGDAGWLCTYYVYDDFGQLRFVIPPAAVDAIKSTWVLSQTNVVNELCFRYEYDAKGRMIAKKVPGAGWVEMLYDSRDRLVYTRDGNMRINHQWMVTLYDELNRQVVTGMLEQCDLSRDQLQPYVDNAVAAAVSIIGAAPSSTPATMSVSVFREGVTRYQATQTITFSEGFNSGADANFIAENVAESQSGFNTQVVVTDPRPANVSFVALTMTYYDNYSELSANTYTDSYNSRLDAGTSIADKVNLAPEPTLSSSEQGNVRTRGLVTGIKVRILEDPTNLSSGKWLTTTTFYDQKARVIQAQSDNAVGGKDIASTRYDFTGKVISNYLTHNNPKSGSRPGTTVKTLMKYDFAGRLLAITKTINDQESQAMQIVANSYDEMGNLKTKELGKKRLETGPLEKLDYNYNVRGWVKGINAAYSHPELTGNVVDRWFGMELNYDWGSEVAGGTDRNQYNGNISSFTWRGKGDGVQRGYGYTYDRANRILSADFSERSGGSSAYTDNANVRFDMVMSNGETDHSGYDANGNIKGMTQWGLKLGSSPVIDQLRYDYYSNSNKLLSVSEAQPSTKHKLGDFTDENSGSDYGYDINGNLITDKNKHIDGVVDIDQGSVGAIIYNYLNLPYRITVANKGTITYVYDAGGNKLRKTVHEGTGPDKVTDYVGGMEYNQDELQFIPHEEGRARLVDNEGVTTQAYDYFVKDHLGNVRMVLSDEQEQAAYPAATLETASLGSEQLYYNIPTGASVRVNVDDVAGYPGSTPKGYAHKLSGEGTQIGSSVLLKVMAGDKVNIAANSWYTTNSTGPYTSGNAASTLATILKDIVAEKSGGKYSAEGLESSGLMSTIASAFINNREVQSPAGSKPKAYLNWILFDNQMKPVITNDGKNSGAEQVGSSGSYTPHVIIGKELTKSGYLYIYVSNETQGVNVFFDNLQVTHVKGPLTEETHYYPFGLTMQGISSKSAGEIENKKKFVSQEFNDDLGWNTYQFKFRTHDPQTGRFLQIDPLSDKYTYNTTYAYAENRPIDGIDLEGKEFLRAVGNFLTGNTAQGTADIAAWYYGKQAEYNESVNASARLATGTSGSAINKLHDQLKAATPIKDVLDYTATVGSLIPSGGEAAAAAEVIVSAGILTKGEAALAKKAFSGINFYASKPKGAKGEELTKGILSKLFPNADILEQVDIKMTSSSMRADFVVTQDGQVKAIFESKVDGSKLSPQQVLFFSNEETGVLSGKNAQTFTGTPVDASKLQTGVYRWNSRTGNVIIE